MKVDRGSFHMLRREEFRQDLVEDSYRSALKLPGPASCPDCGASYREGRWTWQKPVPGSVPHRCPACERIRDDFPAGQLTIRGAFAKEHREELVSAIKAREAREKSEHPLERIMRLEDRAEGLTVTTTGVHLARAIGHALRDAYAGDLTMRYSRRENHVRAIWTR
jgi:NMD protein affecting ribosome stability and mRNA decay